MYNLKFSATTELCFFLWILLLLWFTSFLITQIVLFVVKLLVLHFEYVLSHKSCLYQWKKFINSKGFVGFLNWDFLQTYFIADSDSTALLPTICCSHYINNCCYTFVLFSIYTQVYNQIGHGQTSSLFLLLPHSRLMLSVWLHLMLFNYIQEARQTCCHFAI